MDGATVSVLMPVHALADPDHVRLAVESIHQQSRQPDEFLVVEDGRLPAAVIASLEFAGTGRPVRRVRLEEGFGLAAALQLGLTTATSKWVARMDSDDVSLPGRLEAQLETLRRHPTYDVLGTAVSEFALNPAEVRRIRTMPLEHDKIAQALKRVNPVNHPTVIFRRELAISAGGYRPLEGLEDYDLWARMLLAGATFHNLAEPHLLFRAAPAMFQRRGGRSTRRAELQLQRNLIDYGLVTRWQATVSGVLRIGYRLLPPWAMQLAHRRMFRSTSGVDS